MANSSTTAPPLAPGAAPARFWFRVALLLALAAGFIGLPFVILFYGGRPLPGTFTWDFAMALGFAALALAALQFALTGRLKWLTRPFGADIVYLFHRYLSWGAVAIMLAHFALLYLWHQPALGVLNPLEARWELTSGRLALGCFVALIITSQFRKALRLKYEWWRVLHLTLAIVGFVAAVAHVLGVGNYTANPDKRWLWAAVSLAWLGLLVWVRLVRPWQQRRNPWRVVANTAHRGGVHSLELKPEGQGLPGWQPGQFAWLSVGRSPFSLKEHPFTISSAPEHGPNLVFSIKPLGDDTEALINTAPGTLAYIDGPYGAFSIDRAPGAGGFVMIAGGVGITPILSNLQAMVARNDQRPVIVLYANPDWDSVSFRDELDVMRHRLELTLVHVLDAPPEGWRGESGRIDQAMLERHLPPHSRDWPHMLCNPAPMTDAVRKALKALGVPAHRIDYEVFELV
jgi:predicted ferric reductase